MKTNNLKLLGDIKIDEDLFLKMFKNQEFIPHTNIKNNYGLNCENVYCKNCPLYGVRDNDIAYCQLESCGINFDILKTKNSGVFYMSKKNPPFTITLTVYKHVPGKSYGRYYEHHYIFRKDVDEYFEDGAQECYLTNTHTRRGDWDFHDLVEIAGDHQNKGCKLDLYIKERWSEFCI